MSGLGMIGLGRRRVRSAYLFCDGAIGSEGVKAGAGALLRDGSGRILVWEWRELPALTNNEAEYAGLLLGLELAGRARLEEVHCYLDSEIVVGQMAGRFSVHSARLRRWHAAACEKVREFRRVTFTAIPRERNRLADALANAAMEPWPPRESREGRRP